MAGAASPLDSFSEWSYPFELPEGRSVPVPRVSRNRIGQRSRYFFDPLVALCGGSLTGRRVLDLGCNAGWWSLQAAQAGADFVLGIDGRTEHIEQADAIFAELQIDPDRYRFETGNVFSLGDIGAFDIVLCLGLLYHVAKPFELIERVSSWNTDLLVVETAVNRYPGALLEIHHEPTWETKNAVDYSLVVSPSKQAVAKIASQFGYETVTLKPRFTSYEGCSDYRSGTRRAFFCSKEMSLSGLDIERRRPVRDAVAWGARVFGRTVVKRH